MNVYYDPILGKMREKDSVADFTWKTTDDLIEWLVNFYFTNTKAITALTGQNLSIFTNDSWFISDLTWFDTDNLNEWATNKYYTDAKADARITAQKWQASWLAPLWADSKIDNSYLPAIAIVDIYPVVNETEQLALTVQKWDMAIRSDENKSYVHNWWVAWDMTDWTLLKTPTDQVISVNGKTWVVLLDTWDLAENWNLFFTDARAITAIWWSKNDAWTWLSDLFSASKIIALLTGKEDTFNKNTAFNKNFGSSTWDICEWDDTRLSDSRTPLSHDHNDIYYTEAEVDALIAWVWWWGWAFTFTTLSLAWDLYAWTNKLEYHIPVWQTIDSIRISTKTRPEWWNLELTVNKNWSAIASWTDLQIAFDATASNWRYQTEKTWLATACIAWDVISFDIADEWTWVKASDLVITVKLSESSSKTVQTFIIDWPQVVADNQIEFHAPAWLTLDDVRISLTTIQDSWNFDLTLKKNWVNMITAWDLRILSTDSATNWRYQDNHTTFTWWDLVAWDVVGIWVWDIWTWVIPQRLAVTLTLS